MLQRRVAAFSGPQFCSLSCQISHKFDPLAGQLWSTLVNTCQLWSLATTLHPASQPAQAQQPRSGSSRMRTPSNSAPSSPHRHKGGDALAAFSPPDSCGCTLHLVGVSCLGELLCKCGQVWSSKFGHFAYLKCAAVSRQTPLNWAFLSVPAGVQDVALAVVANSMLGLHLSMQGAKPGSNGTKLGRFSLFSWFCLGAV